jgi:hypothetical protein
MCAQQNLSLSQLGYIGSYPRINTGFSGSPSAAAIAEQGVHFSLDSVPMSQGNLPSAPIYVIPSQGNFPVTEASIKNQSFVSSPLQTLTQSTTPPLFISQGGLSVPQEIRTDEVMEKLLQYGYVVENRVYDGDYPSFLIARTRLGDRVFILIDDNSYRVTFPRQLTSSYNDIQIEKRPSLVLVPQETKMGVLQCLDYDICAAAFVCNNSVCITRRRNYEQPGKSGEFTEENYVFRSGKIPFSGAKIGSSIVAYPIVSLSEILNNPMTTEEKIDKASNEIAKVAFVRLRSYHENLVDTIKRLKKQSKSLDEFTSEAETSLSRDIHKLSVAYEKIKDISPNTLPDEYQTDYYAIQRALANKKELRSRILNSVSSAYGTSGMVRSISEELNNNVNPVINAYKESINLV